MRLLLLPIALLALDISPADAAPPPRDPLGSPMWDYHALRLFGAAEVVFDPRVQVVIPGIAENQRAFPVTIDARGLPHVVRIVLFADLNPIPVALDIKPIAAAAYVSTRIKLDQRTPVRAAVLTTDGIWHVAGAWIDAAGGGCSAPPVSRVKGDWADHLGEIRGGLWDNGDARRLRFSIRHPMDTGLVENIAPYNIDNVAIRAADGTALAELAVSGSVAEDPVITLLLASDSALPLTIAAHDSNGREFTGQVGAGTGSALAAAAGR